ncbi:MAG: hypothetical protein Sv326_1079 [Candidatus Fermentimicrarchaeum limneticum]|uniref:Zona occludens toxin N-terminal domain-containing protein n=1 Tax=Fermentimicrarchaeum limneticum TaxID=2795018 RepID=A0A7D5XIJ6_FERL1|nr:MAG: hypothetical protein Sv326_1079 [Candidatus Fermentimicrarchaeum limneticum]
MANRRGFWGSVAGMLGFIWGLAGSTFAWIYNLFRASANAALKGVRKPRVKPGYLELRPVKVVEGSVESFEEKLLGSKSTVGLILGARGSGKSALGMRILENVHAKSGRAVCAMGFAEDKLPGWVKAVRRIEEVKNGSFVLVDEGGVLFSSRDSMSDANKLLSALLVVARHKDLSILFISQNSANLDVNAIRQADYLLLKKSSLLQKDFERKRIRDIYEEAERSLGKDAGAEATYVYSDELRGVVENGLPSFWSEGVSKSFKNLN